MNILAVGLLWVPNIAVAQNAGTEFIEASGEFFRCQKEKSIEVSVLTDDAEVLGRIVTTMCPLELNKVEAANFRYSRLYGGGARAPAIIEGFLENQAKANAITIVEERVDRIRKK